MEINVTPTNTRGVWFELVDFSDRDYGSDWGYVLSYNGEMVSYQHGFSRLANAGDAARAAKMELMNQNKGEQRVWTKNFGS